MMTMHVLSAGDGYTYYTQEVATGDLKRERGRELGDYYTVDGNPPGIWMGGGVDLLGVNGTVTEEQMRALYGEGLHPDADQIMAERIAAGYSPADAREHVKLGREYYQYDQKDNVLAGKIREGYEAFERMNYREPNAEERRLIRVKEGAIAFRAAKGREPADKEELGKFITAATRPPQQAVAGFDLVFSPAKSVSVLWALGDDDTRRAIEAAHEAAIAETIGYLEKNAVATRAGVNGVAQIDVEGGIIATRFRHYDSRTGDPQLHDHVVIANKVKGSDGKWRTLDSKLLHRMNVPASEHYNMRVMKHIRDALNVTTEPRIITAGKRPVIEIAGIDQRLIDSFSTRSVDIRRTMKTLEKEYRATHGRAPGQKARIQLAQEATIDTRPAKQHGRSLKALGAAWRGQAIADTDERTVNGQIARAQQAKEDVGTWREAARKLEAALERNADPDEIVDLQARVLFLQKHPEFGAAKQTYTVEDVARTVMETVLEYHAVWGPNMIEAEAKRWIQYNPDVFDDQDAAVAAITRAALDDGSVKLTPEHVHGTFQPLTRDDGTSMYVNSGRDLYTSRAVLEAEDRLLAAGRTRTDAPLSLPEFERTLAAFTKNIDDGKKQLAREFVTSDKTLAIGIGPAGTGKTTMLQLASAACDDASVRIIGLAPSAAAAGVIRDDVGIPAHTLHSFINAHQKAVRKGTPGSIPEEMRIRAGDIVVVDEAGMAGTMNLDRILTIVRDHGAHLRLLGDDRQLGAVETAGALRLLQRELGAVELEQVWRFKRKGEADASLILRDPERGKDPFAWYLEHDRIVGGSLDSMTNEVYAAWQADTDKGHHALMIAHQNATVAELNKRAQAYRLSTGAVHGRRGLELRDGLTARTGDTIVTRKNDYKLRMNRGTERVVNGDLWDVKKVHRDGSLTVVSRRHGGTVRLPSHYVTANVELGYATTLHRSQGMTVGNTHVLANSATSRELAYVGLTRGKHTNHLYVETEDAEDMRDVLNRIAENVDTMNAAHDMIRTERERITDLPTLVDEYKDVAEKANTMRFRTLTVGVLGPDADRLTDTAGWPAAAAGLAQAERVGLDPRQVLAGAWNSRDFGDADDIGAVLSYRIQRILRDTVPSAPARLARTPAVPAWIADRTVIDGAETPEDWRAHLADRYDYLQLRLTEVGTRLAIEQPKWTQQLGAVPSDPAAQSRWKQLAAEIYVFRARYRIDPDEPTPIPASFRERGTGEELHRRAKTLHKSASHTRKPPADLDQLIDQARQARIDVDEATPRADADTLAEQLDPGRRDRDRAERLRELKTRGEQIRRNLAAADLDTEPPTDQPAPEHSPRHDHEPLRRDRGPRIRR